MTEDTTPPPPAGPLQGRTVVFLVANEGVEQVELTDPWEAVRNAGGQPMLVAPTNDDVQGFDHLDKADTFSVDAVVGDVSVDDVAGVVLPGGVANPDQLRTEPAAVRFLQQMDAAGRPIAVICHGPWSLIEAGVVDGRTLTSWPSLRTDITNAGGTWVDEPVVRDGNLISSRKPDDLPRFCDALVSLVAGS